MHACLNIAGCVLFTVLEGFVLIFHWTREQGSGSLDMIVTSPKQANRKLLLKKLAIDLCTSERRILFRTQYVSYKTSKLAI